MKRRRARQKVIKRLEQADERELIERFEMLARLEARASAALGDARRAERQEEEPKENWRARTKEESRSLKQALERLTALDGEIAAKPHVMAAAVKRGLDQKIGTEARAVSARISKAADRTAER